MPTINDSWYFARLCSMEAVILQNFPLINYLWFWLMIILSYFFFFWILGLIELAHHLKLILITLMIALRFMPFQSSAFACCQLLMTSESPVQNFLLNAKPTVLHMVDTQTSQLQFAQNNFSHFFIEMQLILNFILISGVQHINSVFLQLLLY